MLTGHCHCGALRWTARFQPESATACNCNACRRYGALWAYGHEDVDVSVEGDSRAWQPAQSLTFNFCGTCGNLAWWRGLQTDAEGRRRLAVNLRLADPEAVAALPIDHFDGLVNWEDLPRDGRCVRDLWF